MWLLGQAGGASPLTRSGLRCDREQGMEDLRLSLTELQHWLWLLRHLGVLASALRWEVGRGRRVVVKEV